MPNHQTLRASILGLLFFAFAVVHVSQRHSLQGGFKPDSIRRTMKMVPPLGIKVKKQEETAVKAGDVITLVATVTPTSPVGRVRWEWQGTAGTEILDISSGYIDGLESGETYVLQVRVKQISDKNEFVHLRIYDDSNRSQLVGAFAYSTLNQEKIEAETAEILERQRIYHEEMEQEGVTILSSEGEANSHEH